MITPGVGFKDMVINLKIQHLKERRKSKRNDNRKNALFTTWEAFNL